MKLIPVQEAVGHVLCHDLTRIVRGEFKGPQFRKGHVVTEEDIPMLLSMGKEHLYVWEMEPGMLHENDGAEALCALCFGENMARSEVKEGKIEITATWATASTSPFLIPPPRICALVSGRMCTAAPARAMRRVLALSVTSTILARPWSLKWVSSMVPPGFFLIVP